MPKIKSLIREISKAYASYVNLKQEFNDPEKNRERMKGYRPIQSHRDALQRLIQALYPNRHRVYALRGSYGTGKSHLFLMLANYFDLKPDAPEMEQFFANYAEQDPDGAQKLQNWRGDGRYLVALCRYGTGDDFEATVLRAIQQASEREGFAGLEDTHYHEALRRLDSWKQARDERKATGQMYDLFVDTLQEQYPGTSLAALREGLKAYEPPYLNTFKSVFQAITGGDFSPEKGNLIDILEEFVSSDTFKNQYQGLVIFYDEFDEILKEARLDVSRFQGFAELCRHPEAGMQPIIFYANIHKPLQGYATAFSKADFQVVSARLKEVQLVSQGIEDIIAAIVVPDQESALWQQHVAPRQQTFMQLVNPSKRADIFSWRSGADFQERIVEDLYPMHPMATHCLVKLSQEVGSNARSLFTFFTSEDQAGGYREFIAATEIEAHGKGRLNFYTVDQLFIYFQGELRSDNTEPRDAVRRAIRDYEASYRQARKSPGLQFNVDLSSLVDRLLKTLLIYKIAGVACTFHNLAFGLHLPPGAEAQLRKRLKQLVDEGGLFEDSGLYEFRQGDVRDFEQLIEAYKTNPANQPEDLAEAVVDAHRLGRGQRWLEAKEHNGIYYEDKRLRRRFIRPRNLNAETFTDLSQAIDEKERWPDRYEGIALYVLCETMDEVQAAQQRIMENKDPRLLIGVPQEPIPIRDVLLTLEAIKDIKSRPEMQEISLPEQARLDTLRGNEDEGALGRFLALRNRYFDGEDLIWFGTGGEVVVSQPEAAHEPADRRMDNLYAKRNRVKHGIDFNKIHVKRTGTSNTQLHDAVRELLELGSDVKIDLDYGDNRGEIRYLKRCFADTGVLVQSGIPQGARRFYRVEHDPAKYRQALPALAAMVEQIEDLQPEKTVSIRALVSDYAAPPYGQGPVALTLFLAFIVRRFGDALSLKRDPTAVGTVGTCSPSFLYDVVAGQHPNAVFERRRITAPERDLIDGIYQLFSAEESPSSQGVMIKDAFAALQTWWEQLTPLAKTPDIYPSEAAESTRRLLAICRGMETTAAHLFLTGDLLTPYGYFRDDAITEKSAREILAGLERDKDRIATRPKQFKQELIETLMSVDAFTVDEDVTVLSDYQRAIEAWYKELDDNQRDPWSDWQSGSSKAVLRYLGQLSDLRETLLVDLPGDPGFSLGSVEQWTTDRTADYLSTLQAALERIAEHRVPVDAPRYEFTKGESVGESGGPYEKRVKYRGPLKVVIEAAPESECAYFTDTGDDPRRPDSQRERVSERFTYAMDRGNKQLRLVSQAESGKYGRVITLELIDEDHKYVVDPGGKQIGLRETSTTLVLPIDRRSFEITLRSLIDSAVDLSDMTKDDVKAVIEDVLAQL